MSSNSSSRRPARRQSRDVNRSSKMALNVDLNDPPVEARAPRVSSRSRAAQGSTAVPVVNPQQGSQPVEAAAVGGFVNSPIDVEAIVDEDDVQMLSSSRGFPQARNQSRRNRPVMVVLDEDMETHRRGRSGVSVEDTVAANTHRRIPPNRIIINAELYSEDDPIAKRKKSAPEPEKVVPKEPIFSCPVCMGELAVPCSTICGHVFCERCIKASVQAQKKCPTCRRGLTLKSFHKVYLPTAN